jgi:hypothetical protein
VLLSLAGVSGLSEAQISYQQPASRVVRNDDGTRLNIKVDPHNQRVEETLQDKNGNVISKLVRELDDALQPLQATKFDGQNRVISKHRYLVLKGRIEEEEVLDPMERPLAKLVFYYDSKGRMNRVDHFNGAGVLISVSRSSGKGVDPVIRDVSGTPTAPSKPGTNPFKK